MAREKGKPFEVKHVLSLNPKNEVSLNGALHRIKSFETREKVKTRNKVVELISEVCLNRVQAISGTCFISFIPLDL